MKKLFVSAKESGNTFEVISSVSQALGSDLIIASNPVSVDLKSYDVIILGSGVYMNKVHKNLFSWLDSTEAASFKDGVSIYLFLTWIGRGASDKAAYKALASYLANKHILLQPSLMECYGNMKKLIWPSHPDEKDISKVLDWARAL
jgi:menaquinone-dependent protoporphyrinogen IX oxidase